MLGFGVQFVDCKECKRRVIPKYKRIDSDVMGDKCLILVFTYKRIDYCT
jgi:hypothetical protein